MIDPRLPVHVVYENPGWLPPLVDGLEAEGFDVDLIDVVEGSVDPAEVPADGIWLNRISPSSHTRGHGTTIQLTREYLFWLEAYGRRVVNGLDQFELEMSKLRQDLVLRKYGIATPRTFLGIHLFHDADAFDAHLVSGTSTLARMAR